MHSTNNMYCGEITIVNNSGNLKIYGMHMPDDQSN